MFLPVYIISHRRDVKSVLFRSVFEDENLFDLVGSACGGILSPLLPEKESNPTGIPLTHGQNDI